MINLDLSDLTARFIAQWSHALPVVFDFQPQAEYPDGHVHFSVLMGASRHAYGTPSQGGKRQLGRVILKIEIPDQQGDGVAIEAIQQFAAIFRNWSNNAIVCRTEELIAPVKTDRGTVRFTVMIPFQSLRPYS